MDGLDLWQQYYTGIVEKAIRFYLNKIEYFVTHKSICKCCSL